jgi:hypothetical protein
MHRIAPQHRIINPKMSLVPRLKSTDVQVVGSKTSQVTGIECEGLQCQAREFGLNYLWNRETRKLL